MKTQHQQKKRGDERQVNSGSFGGAGRKARAPSKHHQETKVLPGVVPRAPANVQCEDPWEQREPDMSEDPGQRQQERDRYCKNAVFLKLRVCVMRTVDRRHEVWIVEEQR